MKRISGDFSRRALHQLRRAGVTAGFTGHDPDGFFTVAERGLGFLRVSASSIRRVMSKAMSRASAASCPVTLERPFARAFDEGLEFDLERFALLDLHRLAHDRVCL